MHWITFASLICFVLVPPAKAENSQLHSAAYHGEVVLVRLLVANGANADARDKIGGTALYQAVNHFHFAAIEALLAGGANFNARTDEGRTPIDAAHMSIEEKKSEASDVPIAAFEEAIEILKAYGGR